MYYLHKTPQSSLLLSAGFSLTIQVPPKSPSRPLWTFFMGSTAYHDGTKLLNGQLLSKPLHFVLLLPTLQIIIFNLQIFNHAIINVNHKESVLYSTASARFSVDNHPSMFSLLCSHYSFTNYSSVTTDYNNL